MLWFKEQPLSLSAMQARAIAQLQTNKLKFEREQRLLKNILSSANSGLFSSTYQAQDYYDNYGMHSGGLIILNEADIKFLENLGYKVEQEIKTGVHYNMPTIPGNQIIPSSFKYTNYIIKW